MLTFNLGSPIEHDLKFAKHETQDLVLEYRSLGNEDVLRHSFGESMC